jgi:DNA invertase Pin-like site-specific DNA recombinase
MGKQKLNEEKVELIKHLLSTKIYKQFEIASYFGISRPNVHKIKTEQRWKEVPTPDDIRGKYLWYKLLNGKLK